MPWIHDGMKCNLSVMNQPSSLRKPLFSKNINFIPGTSVIGASIDKRFTLRWSSHGYWERINLISMQKNFDCKNFFLCLKIAFMIKIIWEVLDFWNYVQIINRLFMEHLSLYLVSIWLDYVIFHSMLENDILYLFFILDCLIELVPL